VIDPPLDAAELQQQIDFIADGCPYNNATFENLLGVARAQCQEEIGLNSDNSSSAWKQIITSLTLVLVSIGIGLVCMQE